MQDDSLHITELYIKKKNSCEFFHFDFSMKKMTFLAVLCVTYTKVFARLIFNELSCNILKIGAIGHVTFDILVALPVPVGRMGVGGCWSSVCHSGARDEPCQKH